MRQAVRDEEFAQFVVARSGALFRTAAYLAAGDRLYAEDLTQATLAELYASWGRIRDPQAREAYARRILARLAYRHWQSKQREAVGLATVPEPSTDGPSPDRVAFMGFLAELPPKQRAVVVLRYYEDMSEREIAAALSCSPGTVKTHAARALASLRMRADLHPQASRTPPANGDDHVH